MGNVVQPIIVDYIPRIQKSGIVRRMAIFNNFFVSAID